MPNYKLGIDGDLEDIHAEFMKRVDGEESPQYYIALAILMLAAEVRDLNDTILQTSGK